jgi:hypothetical protein
MKRPVTSWALIVFVVADRGLELPEPLAECASGIGEAFGSEDQKGYDEDQDQVGGFKD